MSRLQKVIKGKIAAGNIQILAINLPVGDDFEANRKARIC